MSSSEGAGGGTGGRSDRDGPAPPADSGTSPSSEPSRLDRQLAFLLEIDRLKTVLRRSLLADASRRENSAEHSWHLAMAVVVLAEHAAPEVDLSRVLLMVLVHDVVEIDAGDTYFYDHAARAAKAEREREAAERIFGLLPAEQGRELREAWEEFEARETAEARFAYAVDRLQPLLLNVATRGSTWREHGVDAGQVLAAHEPIGEASPELGERARQWIEGAVAEGWLAAGEKR